MIFTETKLNGVFVIDLEKIEDERGFFARTWDQKKFEERDLNPKLVQCSISFNKKKGTLRGMHYQISPYEEAKLVRCTRGKIFDVVIDLRTNTKTFKKWVEVELSAEDHRSLYIPEGCAHGFQTLKDNTEVLYQISETYKPECARGVLWNDPAFQIQWPFKSPAVISKKDLSYELFNEKNTIKGHKSFNENGYKK